MKKHFILIGWLFFVTSLSLMIVTKGYGNGNGSDQDLFETSLTVASSSAFSPNELEAELEISNTGKVELKIEGLRTAAGELVNQDSILVIEIEINDVPQTISEPFTITDGEAELEFTLDGLNAGDKLEIVSAVVNKATTPTVTPTVTASPTATVSPTASPAVSPTPTLTATVSPTPTSSPTATETPSPSPTASPTGTPETVSIQEVVTSDTILVPGGLIVQAPTPTPTPVGTVTPTPVGSPTPTPSVISAEVEIKPETINLKSNGRFKAFIELPSPFNVEDIVTETIFCEGAQAIKGKTDNNRFIATFNIQDLNLTLTGDKKKETVTFTVTGNLQDGSSFEGSDTVKVKGKKGNDGDDDDDDDE